MTTRPHIGLAPALAALSLFACAAEPPQHVVLITVDTLRADRIGAYGYAAARTPNLDRLAAESIRFSRAHAHSSRTLPSIATLLTGLLPSGTQLYTNFGRLSDSIPTLSTRLQGEGFTTAAFIGNYALRESRRLSRGFDYYTQEFAASEDNRPQPENLAGPLTDSAIAWLDRTDPTRRSLLWVHYQEPHGPYSPPGSSVTDNPNKTHTTAEDSRQLPRNLTNSGLGGIPKYQWLGHGRLSEYSERYDGEIAEVDRHIGRLLDALRGRLDRTLLVFAADHGEAFGEENLFCAHGEGLGDALLHVPLLLRTPAATPAVRDDLVRLIDIAPTVLELLDFDTSGLPGTSLLRDLGDRALVTQVGSQPNRRWRAVRADGYELRASGTGESEFRGRPGTEPASDAQQTLAIRQRLEVLLESAAPWPEQNQPVVSDDARAKLRALGYAD